MKNEIIKSTPKINPKKLIIIVRHAERKDRAGEIPQFHKMNPELTERGKLQSFNASKILLEEIKNYGISEISPDNIQIRTSPYMRTIQTATYFIKGLNSTFSNNTNNNLLNKVYIDFSLRKRIKPNQKKAEDDDSLYSSVEAYKKFDEEIKNIEFIGEYGNFPTEIESKEQTEERTLEFINSILKDVVDDKNNKIKIIIIIGHRGPIKFFFKKLGYECKDKKEVDYCSQYYFDVTDGIDNSKFLGKKKIPQITL